MNIGIINRREWASSGPNAVFGTLTAHALAAQGHQVYFYIGKSVLAGTTEELLQHYYGLEPLSTLSIRQISTFKLGITSTSTIFYLRAWNSLSKLLHRRDLDALISRDAGFLPYMLHLKKRHGVRIFYEAHDFYLDIDGHPDLRQNYAFRKKYHEIEKKYLPQTDGIVCLLSPQASLYQSKLPGHRICVAHPGVKPDFQENDIALDSKTICYIGGLQERRDLPTVLDALSRLADKRIKLLIIGGRAGEVERLNNQIERFGLRNRVTSTGWQVYKQIGKDLEHVSVGIVPMKDSFYNRYLTAPVKIFDYLAKGIPVIAADLPSSREFLDENKNAVFYRAGDAAHLAERLTTLFESPDMLRRLASGARRKAEMLSWPKRAQQISGFITGGGMEQYESRDADLTFFYKASTPAAKAKNNKDIS